MIATFLLSGIFFVAIIFVLGITEVWLSKYSSLHIALQWTLFFPFSLLRAGLITAMIAIRSVVLEPINPNIAMAINWIVTPLVLFHTSGQNCHYSWNKLTSFRIKVATIPEINCQFLGVLQELISPIRGGTYAR